MTYTSAKHQGVIEKFFPFLGTLMFCISSLLPLAMWGYKQNMLCDRVGLGSDLIKAHSLAHVSITWINIFNVVKRIWQFLDNRNKNIRLCRSMFGVSSLSTRIFLPYLKTE